MTGDHGSMNMTRRLQQVTNTSGLVNTTVGVQVAIGLSEPATSIYASPLRPQDKAQWEFGTFGNTDPQGRPTGLVYPRSHLLLYYRWGVMGLHLTPVEHSTLPEAQVQY
jgi:hypothetical protein